MNFMIGTALIFLIMVVLTSIQPGCNRESTVTPEKITIAVAVQPISAPVYVAHEKQFFEQQGLQASLQSFWTGKDALEAVMKGQADFCTVAETPLVFSGLKDENFFILATIADSNKYMKIVARRDAGIKSTEDLKGKRIGVSMGTTAEYFLESMLVFNNIHDRNIQKVPFKPEDMAESLLRGEIDAAVTWNPHMIKQQMLLGPNAVTLWNESIYKIYWNIVAAQKFVKQQPETVKKFLQAILEAEKYINNHKDSAYRITSGYVGKDAVAFEDYNFDLRMAQSLVIELEDQANWAIRNRFVPQREIPNFLRHMYPEGIKAVAPDSVTLIHK